MPLHRKNNRDRQTQCYHQVDSILPTTRQRNRCKSTHDQSQIPDPSSQKGESRRSPAWYRGDCRQGFFRSLLPTEWSFPSRISHPPTDSINALLSLGYTLTLSRCQQLIAAADLDPLVGFLHELRSGRPSLACDVMEPLRVPMVDRWILSLLVRKQLTADSFEQDQHAFRLKPSEFKDFIGGFEKQFLAMNGSEPSFRDQTQTRTDGIADCLRVARHSVP